MSYLRDLRQPPKHSQDHRSRMASSPSRLASQQAVQSSRPPSRVRVVESRAQSVDRKRDRGSKKVLLAGSSMAVLALLAFVPAQLKPQTTHPAKARLCQNIVKSGAELSRDQLSRLLVVPERSSKQAVQRIVQEPYCVLQPLPVREGAKSVREAYPLAFDPSTWFVVLYEGEEYAGYDFTFRQ